MFEKAYCVWIVYQESFGTNLAVCESEGAAHLWIHEYVPVDEQGDCFIESLWLYSLKP